MRCNFALINTYAMFNIAISNIIRYWNKIPKIMDDCESMWIGLFVIFILYFSDLCSIKWWNCCTYWIGGTDFALEGTFIWTSDNSILGFENWYRGEPDNAFGYQDCVSICRDGHWADMYCETSNPYICKAPAL